MSKSNSLKHAHHNKKVCESLSETPEYTDWIITTAFYSALHFVDYKIFPLKLKKAGRTYSFTNFDNYYMFLEKNIGKHKARLELVEAKLPKIATHYNKLMDLCHKARYVDYKFDYNIAKDAKERLKKIEEFCIV